MSLITTVDQHESIIERIENEIIALFPTTSVDVLLIDKFKLLCGSCPDLDDYVHLSELLSSIASLVPQIEQPMHLDNRHEIASKCVIPYLLPLLTTVVNHHYANIVIPIQNSAKSTPIENFDWNHLNFAEISDPLGKLPQYQCFTSFLWCVWACSEYLPLYFIFQLLPIVQFGLSEVYSFSRFVMMIWQHLLTRLYQYECLTRYSVNCSDTSNNQRASKALSSSVTASPRYHIITWLLTTSRHTVFQTCFDFFQLDCVAGKDSSTSTEIATGPVITNLSNDDAGRYSSCNFLSQLEQFLSAQDAILTGQRAVFTDTSSLSPSPPATTDADILRKNDEKIDMFLSRTFWGLYMSSLTTMLNSPSLPITFYTMSHPSSIWILFQLPFIVTISSFLVDAVEQSISLQLSTRSVTLDTSIPHSSWKKSHYVIKNNQRSEHSPSATLDVDLSIPPCRITLDVPLCGSYPQPSHSLTTPLHFPTPNRCIAALLWIFATSPIITSVQHVIEQIPHYHLKQRTIPNSALSFVSQQRAALPQRSSYHDPMNPLLSSSLSTIIHPHYSSFDFHCIFSSCPYPSHTSALSAPLLPSHTTIISTLPVFSIFPLVSHFLTLVPITAHLSIYHDWCVPQLCSTPHPLFALAQSVLAVSFHAKQVFTDCVIVIANVADNDTDCHAFPDSDIPSDSATVTSAAANFEYTYQSEDDNGDTQSNSNKHLPVSMTQQTHDMLIGFFTQAASQAMIAFLTPIHQSFRRTFVQDVHLHMHRSIDSNDSDWNRSRRVVSSLFFVPQTSPPDQSKSTADADPDHQYQAEQLTRIPPQLLFDYVLFLLHPKFQDCPSTFHHWIGTILAFQRTIQSSQPAPVQLQLPEQSPHLRLELLMRSVVARSVTTCVDIFTYYIHYMHSAFLFGFRHHLTITIQPPPPKLLEVLLSKLSLSNSTSSELSLPVQCTVLTIPSLHLCSEDIITQILQSVLPGYQVFVPMHAAVQSCPTNVTDDRHSDTIRISNTDIFTLTMQWTIIPTLLKQLHEGLQIDTTIKEEIAMINSYQLKLQSLMSLLHAIRTNQYREWAQSQNK